MGLGDISSEDIDWAIDWAFVHTKIRKAAEAARAVRLTPQETLVLLRALDIMFEGRGLPTTDEGG